VCPYATDSFRNGMCAQENFNQYLFCDKTKEKLHQRTRTSGGINYMACAILRIDNSLYANSAAAYRRIMEITKNQVKCVAFTHTCFSNPINSMQWI
jgi:hypothetical protein